MKEKDWFKIDSKHPQTTTIEKSQLTCPRDEEILHTIEHGDETGIKVNVCSKCEGLWLDAGDIYNIHKAGETGLDKFKDILEEELTAIELFMIKIGPYLPK